MTELIRRVRGWLFPGRPGGAAASGVFLTAFGKHPGWDDHIRDIDIPTKRLVALSQSLYERGIQANIDGGKWESLEPAQRLEDVSHVFVWAYGAETVVGRVWPSEDGKGRKKYPMVVCGQFSGIGRMQVAAALASWLEPVAEQCKNAATSDAVRQVISDARADLQRCAQQFTAGSADAPCTGGDVFRLAQETTGAPVGTRFYRILYQMDGALAAYRPPGSMAPSLSGGLRPVRAEHFRVPVGPGTGLEGGLRWLQFFLSYVSATTPCLLLMPSGRNWVDLIVGEPTTTSLFCLRASDAGIPLVSDVPFDLSPAFEAECARFVRECEAGTGGVLPVFPQVKT